MANPFGKSRKKGNPYFCIEAGPFKYEVLKLYKAPAASLADPYSRAFCYVHSPMCGPGGGEYGDTYVKDIPGLAAKLSAEVGLAALTKGL